MPNQTGEYERAPWAFGFALGGMLLRGLVVLLSLAAIGGGGHGRPPLAGTAEWLIPVLAVLGTLAALTAVAYAAIASHRRERGVLLVSAWILAGAAVLLDVRAFVYVAF